MRFFFFFSSRRRHTRYWRDWSSDVCSSDLLGSYGDRLVAWVVARLPIVPCLGLMEHFVGSGHLKALDVVVPVDGVIQVLKAHIARVGLDGHALERGTLAPKLFHSIRFVEGLKGQSSTHLSFLGGMDLLTLVVINKVIGADEAAVGYL